MAPCGECYEVKAGVVCLWSTPERLRGEVFTMSCYTNLRLPLPLSRGYPLVFKRISIVLVYIYSHLICAMPVRLYYAVLLESSNTCRLIAFELGNWRQSDDDRWREFPAGWHARWMDMCAPYSVKARIISAATGNSTRWLPRAFIKAGERIHRSCCCCCCCAAYADDSRLWCTIAYCHRVDTLIRIRQWLLYFW